VIAVDGTIDTAVLQAKVDADRSLLSKLDRIVWRAVEARLRGTLDALNSNDTAAAGTYVEGGQPAVEAAARSGRRVLFV